MRALDTAQIDADLLLERQISLLTEVMAEQDIFRRDGRIRFELEHEMPVRLLFGKQA